MRSSARVATLLVVTALVVTGLVACQPQQTNTLTPVADTLVDATTPTTAYGTTTPLGVDASPQREMLLRFDLTGLTGAVLEARLRLHVADVANAGSPDGGVVSRVNGSWDETTTTWTDRPTDWAPAVGEFGAVTANTWVELTVTAAVTIGGPLTLGLRSPNSDGAQYDSRESGAFAPQLIVVTGTAPGAVVGPVVAAVGDMACAPGSAVTAIACRQGAVSDRLVADTGVTKLLALGDLQYEVGALSAFQASYDPSYGRLKSITHPAPGNHEYGTAGAAGYYSYFGAAAGDPAKGYYSVDVGTGWHVVVLNSNCTIVSCAAGSAQEQWLRADLAATTRACVAAIWHHPRFTSSAGHGNDTAVTPLWQALDEVGADLVLAGHVHDYERFAPQTADGTASTNGIRGFNVGTGGRNLVGFLAPKANSQVRLQAFGYLRLTLGSTRYGWQFVDEAGTVRDAGSAHCH